MSPKGEALSPQQQSTLGVILTRALALGLDVRPISTVTHGNRITLYRLAPQGRTKTIAVEALAPDLALALCTPHIVVKPLAGEGVMGIYVPNKEQTTVLWRNLVGSPSNARVADLSDLSEGEGHATKQHIPLYLGTDWLGKVYIDDLTTLPHLLIAGSTGGGKSVLLRSMCAGLLYSRRASEVKLVLSDTKAVEFTDFVGCPHLMWERATNPLRTIEYLENLCEETDQRLQVLSKCGAKNIQEYNAQAPSRGYDSLPYIVLVIDELADIVSLKDAKGKKVTLGIEKVDYLSRKARAAGIHVIAATQRPSIAVVAGDIKSNFLARLSFRMPTEIDSRVVLDEGGAQYLMERGDMLYKTPNFQGGLLRLHSGLATQEDVQAAVMMAKFHETQPVTAPQNRQLQ
jgi:S-DNA-T family DNA segregation ATPase FtsK/SpoIIIE